MTINRNRFGLKKTLAQLTFHSPLSPEPSYANLRSSKFIGPSIESTQDHCGPGPIQLEFEGVAHPAPCIFAASWRLHLLQGF